MSRKRKYFPGMTCSVNECDEMPVMKGKCRKHYQRDYMKNYYRKYVRPVNQSLKEVNKDG